MQCHHTTYVIYRKFGDDAFDIMYQATPICKHKLAEPGPQHQLSMWEGTISKASGLDYERTRKSQCKKVTGHFTVTYGTDKVRSHGMVSAAIFLPSQLDCIITNGVIHTVWLWLLQWHHAKVSQPQPHRVNTFSLLRQKKSQTAAQCERT